MSRPQPDEHREQQRARQGQHGQVQDGEQRRRRAKGTAQRSAIVGPAHSAARQPSHPLASTPIGTPSTAAVDPPNATVAEGRERLIRIRRDDLERRFPGLLGAVLGKPRL